MKNKSKPSAPRNHVVIALLKRGAGQGVHDKSEKAKRRSSKVELLKAVSSFILTTVYSKECIVLSNLTREVAKW